MACIIYVSSSGCDFMCCLMLAVLFVFDVGLFDSFLLCGGSIVVL